MGVEFEWELDSEHKWQTPPPERPPRTPRRTIAIVLVVLLVGLVIGAGRLWQQVRQGEENLKRDLKSVANLEARALREGDRATFLWLQDQEDTGWYARQEERFASPNRLAELEPAEHVTLAVLDAGLIPDNRAWAEVAWALEDGVYRRVQFYRRADGRWLRTEIQPEYFASQQGHETAHFTFSYLARDTATAEWIGDQLEAWYAAICADLGCDDQRTINVLLTLDANAPLQYRPPQGFTLVSPRPRGVRENGALLPGEREQLARMLIYLLAVRQAGDIQPDQQPYLLWEFTNWELGRLGLGGDEASPSLLLDYVVEARGIAGVRALLEAMSSSSSEGDALQQVLSAEPGGLDRFPWDRRDGLQVVELLPFDQYLLALLTVERQVMEWQGDALTEPTVRPLARQIFGSLLADRAGAWRERMQDAFTVSALGQYVNVVPLGRPEVLRWAELDDKVIWAEVRYVDGGPAGGMRRIEFFRNVDGAWRHASPDRRFLGEEVTLDAAHFRLVCHEREAAWLGEGLADLESLYRHMAGAVGTELPTGERLTIRVTPETRSAYFHFSPGDFEAWLPSPYLSGWTAEGGGDYLVGLVPHWLLAKLAFRAAGVEDRLVVEGRNATWWHLIVTVWQWQILGDDTGRVVPWYGSHPEPLSSASQAGELLPLSELDRMTFGPEPFVYDWVSTDWELLYQEMAALVRYAGQSYGQKEAFLALLRSLPEAASLEDWLRLALDVDPQAFETEWRAWLKEQLRQ